MKEQSILEAGQLQTYVLLKTFTANLDKSKSWAKLVNHLEETSTAYGMHISAEKTQLMASALTLP